MITGFINILKNHNPRILVLGIAIGIAGCEDSFMRQTTADKTGAIATLKTTIDDSGNHIAAIDPTSSATQLMQVTSGAISGAAVAIPPMAISIPVSITVGEGVALASNSFSRDLGLTDNKISAGGPSVSFTASQDVTATNPMTLSIPFGALSLALADVDTENLVVMYRWMNVVNGEPSYEVGVLPGDKVTRGKGKVSFQTTKFGTFQVGVAETKISKPLLAATEEPPALKSCERYAAAVYPPCTSDGQVGCVTTDAFKAADMSMAKSEFILDGKKIASVTGNVTLPDTGKVLKDTKYGVAGTEKTGALILPAADKVLASSPAYGDPGAVVRPALPDKGVMDLNSAFGGAGYYSDFKNAPLKESIASGTTIAGVDGSATLAPQDCSSSIQQSCVAKGNFKAIDTTTIDKSKILDSLTVGGITGGIKSINVLDLATSIPSSGYYSGTKNQPISSAIATGYTVLGVSGQGAQSGPPNCSLNGQQSCVATGAYFAGTTCTTDGSNCFLPAYSIPGLQNKKAIDFTTIDQTKMLDTLTVSGIKGTIASKGVWNLTTAFPGAGYYTDTNNPPASASIASNTSIVGVAGTANLESHANCAADGATGCVVVGPNFAAAATSNPTATAANILTGKVIAGITGTATPRPANCSSDGDRGCVVVAPDFAAAVTAGAGDKILSGFSVGGVPGNVTLPPAGSVALGIKFGQPNSQSQVTGTLKLPPADKVLTSAGTYGDPDQSRSITPLLPDRGTWDLTTAFPGSGYYSGTTNPPSPTTVAIGTTLLGVQGSLSTTTTTQTFDPWDLRGGVNAGGILGELRTNCRNFGNPAVFSSQLPRSGIISNTSFFTINLTTTSDASMFAQGEVVILKFNADGVTKTYKVISISGTSLTLTDNLAGTTPSVVQSTLLTTMVNVYKNMADPFETIDDSLLSGVFQPLLPNGWQPYNRCGGIKTTTNSFGTWIDVTYNSNTKTSDTCSSTYCAYKDLNSRLIWSRTNLTATAAWNSAQGACASDANLNLYPGANGKWRLPTQKELMTAYVNGLNSVLGTGLLMDKGKTVWSNTTFVDSAGVSGNAWSMYLATGQVTNASKSSNSYNYLCVNDSLLPTATLLP